MVVLAFDLSVMGSDDEHLPRGVEHGNASRGSPRLCNAGGVLRITLDTNTMNPASLIRIEAACAGRDVEIRQTTITDREQEGTAFAQSSLPSLVETGIWGESRWGQFVWGSSIPETLVMGESRIGLAALGDDASPTRIERILQIISDGSFPSAGERDTLSEGERKQLRDAMILDTHVRERRDVFVTNDAKAFIRHGRRERLETLGSTRIMTVDELCLGSDGIRERRRRCGGPSSVGGRRGRPG